MLNVRARLRSSTGLRFLFGSILGVAILVLTFWNADWRGVSTAILEADYRLILVGLLSALLGLWLRAWRWRILFFPDGDRLAFSDLLDGVNIGYLTNNLLPARIGDVARCYLLSRWSQVGIERALSTTLLERLIDSLAVIALFFIVLPFLPISAAGAATSGLLAAVFLVALAMFALAAWKRERARRILRRILGLLPWIDAERWSTWLVGLLSAFEALRQPRILTSIVLVSILIWGHTVFTYWLVMQAFTPLATPMLAGLAVSAAALGLALVSAPSGLGTFEGAVTGALVMVALGPDLARSMAIVLHAVVFVSMNMAGIWSLARRGLGYRQLINQVGMEPQAADAQEP